MLTPELVPTYLERVERAQDALNVALAQLTDTQAVEPSQLPGWTRAHLLTHIARNGESLSAMLHGAARGVVIPQYDGSRELRDAQIDAGAGRLAAELAEDVARTSANFLAAGKAMPAKAWASKMRWLVADLPAPFAVEARWREVEIHRLDLGLGYSAGAWPQEFVAANLPRELARLGRRAPDVQVPSGLADAELLAWLFGRPPAPDLPPLPPWG